MKLLTQQQTAFSPEINAIFDDEFFTSIGIFDPVPVLFLKKQTGNWAGFCQNNEFTENDEIFIDRELIEPSSIPLVNERWLRHVYIHELCHRLLPDDGHSIRFFALNITLQWRASDIKTDAYFWERCNLYDIRDCIKEDLKYAIPLALDFCNRYCQLKLSAKELAKLATSELTDDAILKFKFEQNHQVPELRKQVEELISKINLQRFKYFCFGMASTLFCALAVKYAV